MRIFSADFETTTSVVSNEETRVWAGAMIDIAHYDDDSYLLYWDSIEEFFDYIQEDMMDGCLENGDVLYFHNLKFDGSFILNHILREGYKYDEDCFKKYSGKWFSTLISDMGTWYEIKINYRGKKIEIKNSLCLVASSVAAMGDSFGTKKRKLDMDYDASSLHFKLTDEDKAYIAADVQIVAEVLNTLIHGFGFEKLTAGANSLNFFIDSFGGKDKFRKYFPYIDDAEDDFIRASYKGGWCYKAPGAYMEDKGQTFDVNSLYPSMMHSISGNIYPVGNGIPFDGEPNPDEETPLWIAKCHILAHLKEKHHPCVQIKKSYMFAENEWLTDLENPETAAGVELTVTSVDWELISESYEIEELRWEGGYYYEAREGLFDEFIDYWYDIKRNSKGAKKQLAKIILNSFYGKFGTRTSGASKIPYLEDGVLKFNTTEEEERKGIYLPVACFTTAYARRFTITHANANFDRFCYADTDSIHMRGWEEPAMIRVHDSDMCAWKCEGQWSRAKFLRQKTYMEEMEGGKLDIKCAGMPESIKYHKELDIETDKITKVPNITFEDFEVGHEWVTGKLEAKQVKGGVLLLDKPFSIRA